MLLSDQPGQPLVTAGDLAHLAENRIHATVPTMPSEPSVRGHRERGARMRKSTKMGPATKPSKEFTYVPTGLTTGVLFMAGIGMFAASPLHAQSASSFDKKGQAAEAREDYDKSYEDYRQAHIKKPKDLRYREHYESMRYTAANMHVDRGRILRNSGDIDGAINEFARALQIDPGNQAAAQELQLTEKNGTAATAAATPGMAGGTPPPSSFDEQLRRKEEVSRAISTMDGPVILKPLNTDPVTLHMVEDSKIIYQAIGKAAGLNVIFDPDYTSKRIPIDLTNMTLADALRIVGTMSGTFWKPVTENTIFVAQNNRTKHTDLDDLAVETFYLTNVSQQNDANEILVALRNLLDPSVKVYLVASQNAIVMRARPDELMLAEKIINDLDRTKPEVVVDVAVLEVSRTLERDLGITLPTSFGLTPQYSNANISSSSTTTSTSTSSSSSITLNTLGNLNATNFAVSLTGGQVNALLSDADTRILQNPRVRATDGQNAVLKIGSKIPVATGSYSAGAAITTASLGVQTQFTYLDVGVLIDITPTVHLDREVSLKLKVEISSQTSSVTISGVTEPVISQRTVNQVIQLKDGEPSILAGLLQKQDQLAVSGTPGLGEIPFLKYFFSSQDKTQSSDELVFLMIPHIVRESILTRENTSPIYTGTTNSVDIRQKTPAEIAADKAYSYPSTASAATNTTTASRAATAAIGTIASDAKPLPPPSAAGTFASTPGVTPGAAAANTVTLSILPGTNTQAVGSTFSVALTASNAHDLASVPVQLKFDPAVLQLVDVDSGPLLSEGNQAVALTHRDEGNGFVTLSATRPPNTAGANGQGVVATLTFKAISAGDTTIAITKLGAKNSQQVNLPALGNQATVHVK